MCPEPRFVPCKNYKCQGPKNQKFNTKSTLKKLNEPVLEGVAMSELSNGTKNHTSKSRETIPLTEILAFRLISFFLNKFFDLLVIFCIFGSSARRERDYSLKKVFCYLFKPQHFFLIDPRKAKTKFLLLYFLSMEFLLSLNPLTLALQSKNYSDFCREYIFFLSIF
jgi:hypothetical protein